MQPITCAFAKMVRFLGGFALISGAISCGGSGTPDTPDTADVSGAICARYSSGFCDGKLGCPDSTGCNWCQCSTDGLVCNQAACPSRAKQTCTAASDCAAGEACIFDPDCTATTGRCAPQDLCALPPLMSVPVPPDASSFCDCSNKTQATPTGCGIGQPYKHAGPC